MEGNRDDLDGEVVALTIIDDRPPISLVRQEPKVLIVDDTRLGIQLLLPIYKVESGVVLGVLGLIQPVVDEALVFH